MSNTSGNGVPPILFIIFSQPQITAEVFAAIREARPRRLYIAADGPRPDRPGEAEECAATRSVVSQIDWECECHTLFRTQNVGCRVNVSEAINWFLEAVGEGIILEYDCLPHPSFFSYCAELLDRYREDSRVMSICGSNLQFGNHRGDGDYFFARMPNTWGWATWKRAWSLWDGDVKTLPGFLSQNQLDNLFSDRKTKSHLAEKFQDVYYGRNRSTWGFGWVYAHFAHGGLSVFPNANLISNLGFTRNATHAVDEKSVFSRIPLEGLATYNPPTFAIPFTSADEYIIKLATFIPLHRIVARSIKMTLLNLLPSPLRAILRTVKAKWLLDGKAALPAQHPIGATEQSGKHLQKQ